MTQKEFFTQVISMTTNKEMVEFSKSALARIEAKNEKAKATRIAKSAENEPLLAEITTYLGKHKVSLASEVATACGVSTSKASAMLSKLVDKGVVSKSEVSISKVGKRMAYRLIVVEQEEIPNE